MYNSAAECLVQVIVVDDRAAVQSCAVNKQGRGLQFGLEHGGSSVSKMNIKKLWELWIVVAVF